MANRNELIWQLSKHGIKRQTLEEMSTKGLINLFNTKTKERLESFLHEEETQEIDTGTMQKKIPLERYKSVLGQKELDFVETYKIAGEILQDYSLQECVEIMTSQSYDRHYKIITRIAQIKYYETQEILLDKLRTLYGDFPKEERAEQMRLLEQRRGNLDFLRKRIALFESEKEREKMDKIADLKYVVLTEYFPTDMQENYPSYYNNMEQKNKIIDRIMEQSSTYKRSYLRKKTVKELKRMEYFLQINDEREEREEKLVKEYEHKFMEMLSSEDEEAFGILLNHALNDIGQREVERITNMYGLSSNPLFAQKYIAVMRTHFDTPH